MKAASVTAGTATVVAVAMVAVAMVAAAATTSPGRANWSPWKPSRSQSGVHSYVHLPLSWRVCNPRFSPPRAARRPYKPAPSLAFVSRRALSTLSDSFLSLCLSVQVVLSSAIPHRLPRFSPILFILYPLLVLPAHDLVPLFLIYSVASE